jgi:hypothetical protein
MVAFCVVEIHVGVGFDVPFLIAAERKDEFSGLQVFRSQMLASMPWKLARWDHHVVGIDVVIAAINGESRCIAARDECESGKKSPHVHLQSSKHFVLRYTLARCRRFLGLDPYLLGRQLATTRDGQEVRVKGWSIEGGANRPRFIKRHEGIILFTSNFAGWDLTAAAPRSQTFGK